MPNQIVLCFCYTYYRYYKFNSIKTFQTVLILDRKYRKCFIFKCSLGLMNLLQLLFAGICKLLNFSNNKKIFFF